MLDLKITLLSPGARTVAHIDLRLLGLLRVVAQVPDLSRPARIISIDRRTRTVQLGLPKSATLEVQWLRGQVAHRPPQKFEGP